MILFETWQKAEMTSQARNPKIARAYDLDVKSVLKSAGIPPHMLIDEEGPLNIDLGCAWSAFKRSEQRTIFQITEDNMSIFYGSQWTKIKKGKDKEMSDGDARYLIVRNSNR